MAGLGREARQEVRQRLRCAFHAGRHDSARDHGGLQQSKVVAGEIEEFGKGSNLGGSLQIHADQAEHGLIDHAEPGFNRRRGRPTHGQVDRDIENASAFGEIHPQKENVAPSTVSQIHADRRSLVQDGEQRRTRAGIQKFGAQAQRVVGGMPGAEHPLIAANGAHAAAHLVGQSLKREPVVAGGEGAGDSRAGPLFGLRGQEDVDGLLKAALQQVGISGERDERALAGGGPQGNVKAVDGVEEEQGADALVEVVAGAAEAIEFVTLRQ